MRKHIALILAIVMCISLFPAVSAQTTQEPVEAYEHEFVFTLDAFNSDKMITGASSAGSATEDVPYYGSEAVLYNSALYYRPGMHWDYTVPAKYSNTDPKADFKVMNLEATDPWAFEAHKNHGAAPYVYGGTSGAYFFEFIRSSFADDATDATNNSFVAFRLKVGAPGYYDISVLSKNRQNDSPVTAVYFFKDGTEGVTNSDITTYPSSAKLGYYDLYNALKKYKVVGEAVKIEEAGEYIIAFVGDASSAEAKTNATQRFYLSGVKLTPVEVEEDLLTSISATADKTTLALGGGDATISVKATYSVTGEKTVAAADATYTVAPEGVVSVSAAGVVSAVSAGEATVTVTHGGKSDTINFTVIDNSGAPEAYEHEFVFTLDAFNSDKMITGASSAGSATEDVPYYGSAAVLYNSAFYYRPGMHWDYTVPAKYSNTDPKADFKAMNLEATDPWAWEAHKNHGAAPYLTGGSYGAYFFEFVRSTFADDATDAANNSFVAFRLKVGAPGKYDISVLSKNRQTDSPVTAVYFFKDGTEGVTNSDITTYPSSAKLGYYDLYNALKKYKVVGEAVEITEAGEYILAFVGDATSAEKKTNAVQRFYLSGIKLTPAEVAPTDALQSISASADKADLLVGGETAKISAKATYSISGEKALAATDVTYTAAPAGIVSVSADGTVTPVAKGSATVTVSYNGKSDTVNFTVDEVEDKLSSIIAYADRTALYIGGDTAKISLIGKYTVSEDSALSASDVTFTVAPEGVITVSDAGIVTAVALGTATVTATSKTDGAVKGTLDFAVLDGTDTKDYSYVLGLSAFNKANMIMGANDRASATEDVPYYLDAAVLRNTSGGVLYYTPAMHWDYTVPAKYSSTDPKADFKSMNLTATDPWAFEAHKIAIGQPIVYDGMYRFEFGRNTYTTSTPSYVAYRLKVDKAGEYILQMKATGSKTAPVPAIYFFRDGTAGITNNDISTYPSYTKLGYYDIPNNGGAYKSLGKVSVPAAGEYIVALVADATSYNANANVASTHTQTLDLSGIKLVSALGDTLGEVEVTAEKTNFMEGDTANLTIKGKYEISGELEIPSADAEITVAPAGVVTVSDAGVITAVGEGSATITVSYKGKSDTIDVIVQKNVLSSVSLKAEKTRLLIGQATTISASEIWSVTGEKALDLSAATITVSPAEGVVSISDAGVVTGVGEGTATITLAYSEKTDTVDISVVPIPAAYTQEFVFGLKAFNKDKMIMGANSRGEATADKPYYFDAPVMRDTSGGVFYYKPGMHWDYIVPAKYSNTDPKADFPAMKLSETAPWALEDYKTSIGQAILYDGMFALEFKPDNYGTASPSYAAFRLNIEAPGEYIIQTRANKQNDAPCPAVYFFRDGTEGVTNTVVTTYPESAKLGYLNIPKEASEYKSMGIVKITEPGEYIVAFVGDETSKTMNDQLSGAAQRFQLLGIKLIPTSEDRPVAQPVLAAKNQLLMVGREMQITMTREYQIAGTVKIDDLSIYEFTSSDETVATVDANGLVKGIAASANPVTITATLKSDPTVKGTILFKVVPESDQQTYEYKFTASAFNYDQMEKVPGIVAKVTDDYYYRDLLTELGFAGHVGIMIMNERLADPELVIPANYYGEGKPAQSFYAMDTTDMDGDVKGTDPWKFVGGKAVDNEKTTLLQIRGNDYSADGLHPYFDRALYTDGADTQFYAISLDIPAKGEYMLTIDAKRHGNSPAPAVYFFKDTEGWYTDASFTATAAKLGYFNGTDTTKQGYEYVANVNAPEAGKYVVAFVMDGNCANLAQGFLAGQHHADQAQYISFFGIKLIPSYEDVCEGLSITAERDVMYSNETLDLSVNEVWDIAGEKEVLDLSSVVFESSDETIATVDARGVVTGVNKGEVTITATKLNTYPEVKATFKVTLYDPNESILGVKLNYVLASTSMKDQTTYNPHNDRLDSAGNLRDLTHVNDYSKINSSLTTLWSYHSKGNISWSALQKRYLTLCQTPASYEKNPYIVLKIRVPIRGEYYFETEISQIAYGGTAAFHLLPASGITNVTGALATEENYVGTASNTMSDPLRKRLGRVNIEMPGDYYVIIKPQATTSPLDGEGRHNFYLNGISLIAPPGEFAKVGMYVEGLAGENDILPCRTIREFTFDLTDAAGVALEDVDYENDVIINSISVTKGADVISFTKENGKYVISTTDVCGEVEITADITYNGKNVVSVYPFAVDDIGKTGRTIYTDEMVANARENIKKYDWAKASRDSAVKKADQLVALGADYLWNIISGQGLPRSYNVALEINHPTRDPYEFYCRYCGKDLLPKHGNYGWVINAFSDPWKIKCPECSRVFPSNDFGLFYELGRTPENHGLWDRITALENHRAMLIEKGLLSQEAIDMEGPGEDFSADWYKYYGYGVKGGYLYNDLYPEVGKASSGVKFATAEDFQNGDTVAYKTVVPETVERWGVDDGYGYNTGRVYTNGVKEVHTYIAYFNHFGVYSFHGTALIGGGLQTLGSAYLYTGDEKYGRLGAILIDRMADVYPDMEIKPWSDPNWRYPNSTGGSPAGKDLGRIWTTFTAEVWADSYDIFYPMFEDPEVIEFLSEKAEYYNLENDKASAIKIRKNGEDGICRAIFDGCKSASILGNFGLHQRALIKAAIALDDAKDTAAMLDWVYASSSTDSNSFNTGGDINSRLIDELYRDGMNRESPYYNQMALGDLIDAALALERYARATGGVDKIMVLEHPKYLQQFTVFQQIHLIRRGIKSFADSSYPLTYPQYPSVATLLKAYKGTQVEEGDERFEQNLKMAQHLYELYGESLRDQHYDIWTKNPEDVYEDVKAMVDKYGEYDYDKSSILTGYGIAVLRDGALYDTVGISGVRDTTRDFMINFSGHNQHNHSDMLDLQMEAYGLGFSYDFGYAEFMVTGDPFGQVTYSTLGHNTVVVDETNSSTPAATPQKPLHFDAKDTRVKVMDARTPDAYPKLNDYRRTVVMVDFDDEVSYGIDFFRVDGGNDHLYTFSPASNTRPIRSDNLTFVKQVDEPQDTWRTDHKNYYPYSSYAGPKVQFGEDPGTPTGKLVYPSGYTWMYDVERCDNPGTGEFWLDYEIKDFKNMSRNPNLDLRLRLTMLNDFDVDEVSLTSMIPQRVQQNKEIDHFEKILVRRKGANLDSLFTTVYEPYKAGERYVTDIEQLSATRTGGADEGANDEVKALKVTIGDNRIDYIVYATNRDVIYTITDGDYSFEFAGFVGVWTIDAEGNNTYSYLHDGSILGEGDNKIESAEAAVTGTVVDFEKELSFSNWIDIEFDRDMTDVEVQNLVDRMIIPEREAIGNSNYLIESITKTGANTARINLGATSTIQGFADSNDESKGYEYILTGGESFEIPMSYEDNGAPVFDAVEGKRVSVGSSITVTVNATPISEDLTVSYSARTLPRGAMFDAQSGTFSWKPSTTQLGKNLVAIDAVDSMGRVSTIYFEVEVLGSVSGGGGGGDTPSTDKPTDEPDEPTVDPDEPTVDPDEPGTDEPTEGGDVAVADGFVDLDNHAWATDAINYLADEGIIKGTSETTFSPANNITRADYAILLVRAFKLESENAENFADVNESDYFAEELAVARNTGIVGGIGDNKYAPRNTITRQDMMVILYRALTKMGIELKPIEGIEVEAFADYADVADYARDAVKALVEAGLVNGKGESLAGSDFTTRAEVAVLLKRVLDYIA